MKVDRYTKVVLTVIAVGLWAGVVVASAAPVEASAQVGCASEPSVALMLGLPGSGHTTLKSMLGLPRSLRWTLLGLIQDAIDENTDEVERLMMLWCVPDRDRGLPR